MLKIGEFSKLSRISIRMLRHYDEAGILKPQSVDSVTGYRFYGEQQLLHACKIQTLRQMGFGVNAIGEILSHYHDIDAQEAYLQAQKEYLLQKTGNFERAASFAGQYYGMVSKGWYQYGL